MHNPDLPKLLRAIASSGVVGGVVEQAAIELEKLEKIYRLYETGSMDEPCTVVVGEILNAN